MTLQLDWPRVFYMLANQYSSRWDERAHVWWARRIMDAVTFEPSKYALYHKRVVAEDIHQLEGLAVAQYGHRVELEIIIPRYDAYVAEMKKQFEAGYPIGNDGRRYDPDEVGPVVDWLSSLDERMLGKLWKLSWAHGVEHARKWHAAMAKAIEDRAAGEKDISRRIDSHDGWTWCRLGSVWAMDREGAVMGHCVGQGGYDGYAEIQSDTAGIWSLRDDKGRSHVTVEIGHHIYTKINRILQAKGPKNRPVTEGEQGHIKLLSKELKLAVPEPGAIGGLGSVYAAWMDGSMRRGWINIGLGEWADANVELERDVGIPFLVDETRVPGTEGRRVDLMRRRAATWGIDTQTENVQRIERVSSRVEMTMRQIEGPSPEVQEAIRQRAASNFTEYMAQRMRVAFGFEAEDEAPPIVNTQLGIAYAFDSQGGARPDGSATADAIANAPRRQRVPPPPPPNYRQHERRGRMYGRT